MRKTNGCQLIYTAVPFVAIRPDFAQINCIYWKNPFRRNFTELIIVTNIVLDGIFRNFAEYSTLNSVLKTAFARPFFFIFLKKKLK